MKFELANSLKVLSKTPTILHTLLHDLPDEWIHQNEGEGTWSPFDVMGHLIQGERTDWIPRARIILANGIERPFTPFDRFAQFELSRGKKLEELLNEFRDLRAENIKELNALDLTDEKLAMKGMHPDLGIVTLEQLLSTWVVHDLAHIHQITRVIAKQQEYDIGPWKQYFSIFTPQS